MISISYISHLHVCVLTGNFLTAFAQPTPNPLHVFLTSFQSAFIANGVTSNVFKCQVFCILWKSTYPCTGNFSQTLGKKSNMQCDERWENHMDIHGHPQPLQQHVIKTTGNISRAELLGTAEDRVRHRSGHWCPSQVEGEH